MTASVAVLDACALVPIRLATTILWLADAGLFQPLWSDSILDEVQRNLPKVGVTPERAEHRVKAMREAFGSEALVDGFEDLIESMTCDRKDRHVLAAAVRGGADTIVTFNTRDFPYDSVAPHGIEVVHPDLFLLRLLQVDTATVVEALTEEAARLRNPAKTLNGFLADLTATVPIFANLASAAASESLRQIEPVPALVAANPEEARAAFGTPGDWTNPTQVALTWWEDGLVGDLEVARALTFCPRAFGDYQWAINHVRNRSLGSRVLYAVDAPDRIAFMRFVPEVAQTSQVFAPYVIGVTFLILRRLEDDTWRVWGLGPGLLSAADIEK